jgi:uncharacterized glyoxalase superfamily protein PhnB
MSAADPDIIPVIPYEDIRAGHDFLVDVLGFTSGGVIEDGNGNAVHGEVLMGSRRIWLHAVTESLASPAGAGVSTAGVVVHVADVDAHFSQARAKGATILREPTDEDYGQREYGVRDPEGHEWYVATPFS